MQVSVPTGMFRVTLLRLCLSAPARTRCPVGTVLCPEAGMLRLPESHAPVGLSAFSRISGRGPCARIRPPWVPEPGLWVQYDFGDGPLVDGRKVVLLVAWLAWSRFRVVIALRDRTAPSVFAGLDRVLRIIGGAPTYVLTDNEKTVTTGHIAGVPVRNRAAVTFGRYYGISVLTCQPADPASKGGVENAVKLAKADLVPTETNLLAQYDCFADVEAACARFNAEINARVHREQSAWSVELEAEQGATARWLSGVRQHCEDRFSHVLGLPVNLLLPAAGGA